ncbi:multidrug effflux MFS transporter [Comamonas sp. J-3]|uniref:multidrug effflux MFS transporter n=1 Tax=Comamonas trifloxystrobinivorans TaxID=3350256 RepID=UPI003726C135
MKSPAVLTVLFALCTMLGPLGIDTYLPSFQAIGHEFNASPATVQQTLSAYVIAMGATMLFYGTLSDTFGRRRVMMVSGIGYCITSLVAAFAPSIESLIVMRFMQGLTAGSGMVIMRAMVQDRYQGAEAQRKMAFVMMIFGVAPALAPIFGGWLQTHGGWRASFYFLSAFGALLALLCWRVLPETLAPEKRVPLKLGVISANYLRALSNRRFRTMLLGLGLMAGASSVYISSAAEFVVTVLRKDVTSFAWLFIPLIGGTMVGSAISGTFAKRLPMRTQKKIGYGCLVLACSSNLLYNSLAAQPEVPWAVLPIAIYTLGISLLMPILTIETMGQFPEMRGLASSLQGFTQMMVFSLISSLLVPHLFHSGLLLAVGQSVVVAAGMLVWWWATRRTGAAAKA